MGEYNMRIKINSQLYQEEKHGNIYLLLDEINFLLTDDTSKYIWKLLSEKKINNIDDIVSLTANYYNVKVENVDKDIHSFLHELMHSKLILEF